MQRIEVEHEFTKPRDKVFAFFAEHENLNHLFPAKVTRVKDGDTERNGVGSVRKLKIGPLPAFEETTQVVVPNERIEYAITKGSPLRGHRGEQTFTDTPSGGTKLRYVIEFGAVVPGLDKVVAKQLEGSIKKGLPKVDQLA